MADTKNPDPAKIEDEVRHTQDEIGDTVEKLQHKMNPEDVTRSIVGDGNTDFLKEALEITRSNPIPVALIAVGLIWLVASASSPTARRIRERVTGDMELRPRSEEPAPIGPAGSRNASARSSGEMDLRSRSEEPAPIGPPPSTGESFDRRR